MLARPLENFYVTLEGVPSIKVKPTGLAEEESETSSGDPAKFLSSHPCELSLKESKVRWNLGHLDRGTDLRLITEIEKEEGASVDSKLVAHAHFHTPGSISGFGIGSLSGRPSRLYKSEFKSGTYFCTPNYRVDKTIPEVSLPVA